MRDDDEIRARFWKALRADRVVMLGLEGAWAEPPRPMTAQMLDDADQGPIRGRSGSSPRNRPDWRRR